MQVFRGATAMEVLSVRVDAGEDLLQSLNKAVSETQLAAGAVVSGCGDLEHLRLEVPANVNWPPTAYAIEKQGPGLINADLLVINKTDLAPHVGADLSVMERDANALRTGPLVFTDCRHGDGMQEVADWVIGQMEVLPAMAGGIRLWKD